MKTRKVLNRYSNGFDFLLYLNSFGMMLIIFFYNPAPSGAAAAFSLGCLNLAGILMIRRREIVQDIEAEQRAARQGELYGE